MDWTEQDQMNKDHLASPQAGDYWHDMYNPVCIVIAFDGNTVTFCRKTKETDDHRWTWDTKKIETMSLADFAMRLHYSSPMPSTRTWASVVPGSKKHLDCFTQPVSKDS